MKKIKRILAVTGIRSEYDILYPVIKRFADSDDFELKVVVSGAHLSDWHGSTIDRVESDGFEIADRIDTLFTTNRSTQRSKAVAQLISGLTQTVEREKPDLLLVVGDREESIATAIVGNYMDVVVAHIGGGDPVWGNADDPIRMAVSKLAHIHFTTAQPYSKNLVSMGEDEWRISFCGTPGLDNITNEPQLSMGDVSNFIGSELSDYIVVLKHPLSSEHESAYEQMTSTLKAIDKVCQDKGLKAVCITPNSDPGSYEIIQAYKEFESDRILLQQTLPRSIFVNLLRNAKALVGNSSMGILEAPMYKLPVVNVGHRQRGRLNAGNVKFVSYQENDIVSAIEQAVFDIKYRNYIANLDNPYGSGQAADIIENFIRDVDLSDTKWLVKEKLV
ncbi:UDP-N-acetylglucosamine 2-epimerase [Vibrio sp. B1ASS3]|uniref:UDP-N-acetylglucosamine 2-epimerase n=1 Tax=Vibrio sp. B1ASS3 TaxID=2751176 RepID=UPI001ABB1E02|nr:UDP-N-acetylglucosamine 2-epimerase [Vibrio sp. B1ASS3]CAD7817571.1 UDP-N-acetylglucosamine 2-epimerase [Vibrio sp. B1ASS3]CAE6931756.1 UDP-N-acetylglucosamine 2-epimerase [Vibrio sp. B1ASS3]